MSDLNLTLILPPPAWIPILRDGQNGKNDLFPQVGLLRSLAEPILKLPGAPDRKTFDRMEKGLPVRPSTIGKIFTASPGSEEELNEIRDSLEQVRAAPGSNLWKWMTAGNAWKRIHPNLQSEINTLTKEESQLLESFTEDLSENLEILFQSYRQLNYLSQKSENWWIRTAEANPGPLTVRQLERGLRTASGHRVVHELLLSACLRIAICYETDLVARANRIRRKMDGAGNRQDEPQHEDGYLLDLMLIEHATQSSQSRFGGLLGRWKRLISQWEESELPWSQIASAIPCTEADGSGADLDTQQRKLREWKSADAKRRPHIRDVQQFIESLFRQFAPVSPIPAVEELWLDSAKLCFAMDTLERQLPPGTRYLLPEAYKRQRQALGSNLRVPG